MTAAAGAALLAGTGEATDTGGFSQPSDDCSGGDTDTQTSTSY